MSGHYTCFGFKDFHPGLKHCTHTYFGEIDPRTEHHIVADLNKYFRENKTYMPELMFGKADYLGKYYQRVLRLSTEASKSFLLLDLKQKLDGYVSKNVKPYEYWMPHITTNEGLAVSAKFDRFYFVQDERLISEYVLENF